MLPKDWTINIKNKIDMDKLPFDDEDEDFMKEYDDENTNSK